MPAAAGGPGGSGSTTAVTYSVRIWNTRKLSGARGTSYQVRWGIRAAGQRSRTFRTRALAESFRAELQAAANRGEPFDAKSGLPKSMMPDPRDTTWWEWTLTYADLKWPTLAPTSRRSMAEALVTATMAMLGDAKTRPPAEMLRRAMLAWAYNAPRRAQGPPPADLADAVTWLAKNSVPLASLETGAKARALLDALSRKLDGTPVAATTTARKRAVIYNVLELAVEHELFVVNPMSKIRWKAPKVKDSFDPRAVINPDQARALLSALQNLDVDAYRVATLGTPPVSSRPRPSTARAGAKREFPHKARRIIGLDIRGRHLAAFFGCMYYSALRPSEVVALTLDNLDLPDPKNPGDGWGHLLLTGGDPEVSAAWTDEGRRTTRQLKHRARGSVRPVPCPPPLVELLRAHLAEFGTSADGHLFRGRYGGAVSTEAYSQAWDAARRQALTAAQYASPLAARPYDLRHTAVSTWLAAGVDSTQVATWAGHSVAVLHRVYAHTLTGRGDIARARVGLLLGLYGGDSSDLDHLFTRARSATEP